MHRRPFTGSNGKAAPHQSAVRALSLIHIYAGIITGLGGYAGHSHKYHKRGGSGYMFRLATVQDLSAVTAACLLVRTAVYDAAHGLDEEFTVAYNDVDFCLRVRDAGWRIVWTPYAQLYHYESKSRGSDENDPAKKARRCV